MSHLFEGPFPVAQLIEIGNLFKNELVRDRWGKRARKAPTLKRIQAKQNLEKRWTIVNQLKKGLNFMMQFFPIFIWIWGKSVTHTHKTINAIYNSHLTNVQSTNSMTRWLYKCALTVILQEKILRHHRDSNPWPSNSCLLDTGIILRTPYLLKEWNFP